VGCLCHGCRGLIQHNDMVSQAFENAVYSSP
jgi:hypothetical protein